MQHAGNWFDVISIWSYVSQEHLLFAQHVHKLESNIIIMKTDG